MMNGSRYLLMLKGRRSLIILRKRVLHGEGFVENRSALTRDEQKDMVLIRPLGKPLLQRTVTSNKLPDQNTVLKMSDGCLNGRNAVITPDALKKTEAFTYGKGAWMCSYDTSWPNTMTISPSSHRESDAARQAALAVFNYLARFDVINKTDSVHSKSHIKAVNNVALKYGAALLGRSSHRTVLIQIRNISSSAQNENRSNIKTRRSNMLEDDEPISVSASSSEIETKADVVNPTIVKLFPQPKNVLHSCYSILASELKQSDLKLTPHYKYVAATSMWNCTYHLKWPEDVKFSRQDRRKQEASHKCAVACLHWLMAQKKITSSGQPLVYDNEVMRDIKQKTVPVLNLSESVQRKLQSIYDLYSNKLLKHLINDIDEDSLDNRASTGEDELEKLWPKDARRKHRQKFLGLDVYEAKEKTDLPISQYKREIIDAIENNRIILIKGEPGCGKSTRIPQYVLEAWARDREGDPCRIVVTQPRRIAAISLAERVCDEREENVGDIVGYQVRLKSSFSSKTGRILYCTTGILLRHIQSDPTLSDCTHILLDEAHERDVNTDLLMNLLKQALKLNPNLKLMIMSATIDTSLFQQYFNNVPVLHIAGFTHPVKAHFIDDFKKLSCEKTLQMCKGNEPYVVYDDVVNLIQFIHANKPEGAILCFLPGWEEIVKVKRMLPNSSNLSVLCLHSKLQDSEQRNVFSNPPPGVRKIVLATNVAETSITINDVVYVVDTGMHKENRLDVERGINCIDMHWISQSSMTQRKGRAGRVRPGESYHLYSKSKSEKFEYFSVPEILRMSLTKVVLDSKVYSNNMDAVEFLSQLPSPPETEAVKQAVDELKELELLNENENLTPLGRVLSNFQLEPKLSKAMVNAVVFNCVTPIVDIVTLFSSEQQEIFMSAMTDKDRIKKTKEKFSKDSDHLSLMRIFEKWLQFVEENDFNQAKPFASVNGLIDYKLAILQKLRVIHFEYLYKGLQNVLSISDQFSDNEELVKAVLLSGVGTVLQHRNWDIVKGRMRQSNVFLTRHNHKAMITSASVNFKRSKFPTNFLLYINETRSNIRRVTTIRETSLISPLAVLLFKKNELKMTEETSPSEELGSQEQVRLSLAGTKIEFICDRWQADVMIKCKTALQAGLQYYVFQLTKGGEYDANINKHWNEILTVLNDIFRTINK